MSNLSQEEFETWRDSLSDAENLRVINRACIDMGWERETKPDGGMIIDGDIHSPEFFDACHQQFLRMYIDEALVELVEEGKIYPSGVDPETGEIVYERVEHAG